MKLTNLKICHLDEVDLYPHGSQRGQAPVVGVSCLLRQKSTDYASRTTLLAGALTVNSWSPRWSYATERQAISVAFNAATEKDITIYLCFPILLAWLCKIRMDFILNTMLIIHFCIDLRTPI
jgi:hypothetical protein